MPLQHAVLALLAEGPSHGYELRGSFEQAVGPQWGGLNIGHLYQVLERLTRDGLVRSQRHPQATKPDRLVLELTESGRAELHRWLAEPAERARGHRDDLFLKLLAASHLPDSDAVPGVLRRQRAYLLRQLRGVTQQRPKSEGDPLGALVAAAAELHLRADLALLDLVERSPFTTDAVAAAASIHQETPDRAVNDWPALATRKGSSSS